MKKTLFVLGATALFAGLWTAFYLSAQSPEVKPLRILLVAGGCCHDYATQTLLLEEGIEARLHADVEVIYNPDTSTGATFEIYNDANWAEGYDLVVHDECSAAVTDPAYVNRILDAHRGGVPAVNLHCAMHSYRWGDFQQAVARGADNAGWYEMIGIQSSSHGPKAPIDVVYTDPSHPITLGMEAWTTIDEELYNNIQIFETARSLAEGTQLQMPRAKKGEPKDPDAVATEVTAVVAWTNEYGPEKTRIFSTTLGHFNETVQDTRYLDLVARGALWATGNLQEDGSAANGLAR